MTIDQKLQFLKDRYKNKTFSFVLDEHNLFGDSVYHYVIQLDKWIPQGDLKPDRNFKIVIKFISVIREQDGVDVSDADKWLGLLCNSNWKFKEALNKICIREIRRISKNYLNHPLGDITFAYGK